MIKDINIYTIGNGFNPWSTTMMWRSQIDYWKRMDRSKAEHILSLYVVKKMKERKRDKPLRLSVRGISTVIFSGEKTVNNYWYILGLLIGFYKRVQYTETIGENDEQ